MKLVIFAIKFLFIAGLFIVSNFNLAIYDHTEREQFFSMYYAWFENTFSNVNELTGYVVSSEWLPGRNLTIKSSNDPILNDERFEFGS